MKILLIYPYFLEHRIHEEEIAVVPIGLYCVGALLKEHGYNVEILNWHNMKGEPEKIEEILNEKKPGILGFSIFNANRWGGIDIARIAKKIDPMVKIVFGGIGATFLWEHFLTHFPDVDFTVMGEGEYSFLNLVKRIEEGHADFDKIKGIAFRKGNRVFRTEEGEQVQDLDQLPDPARYFVYQHVSSSRGCPGNCTFCGSPLFWGHKVRFHSPAYFVDQLERLYRKGVNFFYVSDDTFTLNKDRVIEICKTVLEKKLPINWAAISRVNYVNEEMLYWMRKAGCIQISYGIESGSKKIRDRLNKNIRTEQIKRAFSLTTKYGILSRAYFIYGSPGETWETIRETIDLMNDIKPLSTIFYILDIFPGTALYSVFTKRLRVTDDIWLQRIEDIMYFESDPQLTRERVLSFGKTLRTAFYENIHRYAEDIELATQEDLYPLHADFLSRLGLTFSHGDYAQVETIKEKEKIAEKLFIRALSYFPDHRAYLGLGIIYQKNRAVESSIRVLSEGIRHFPKSAPLNLCLGISLMNAGEFERALSHLLPFKDSKDAILPIANCYKALGDSKNEAAFLRKLNSLK